MDRKAIICCLSLSLGLGGCSGRRHVAVGSKNFTEQTILGEIIAQHIENRTKQPVDRKLNLGGTLLAHQALTSREIDVYPEYTGTAFTNVLKLGGVSDADVVLDRVRGAYSAMQIEWLNPLGFNNSFAMTVRGADARERKLETLSDAAADARGFILGAGYEFLQRPDGFGALNQAYPIHWNAAPKSMDLGLLYTALAQKQVGMAAGSTTDGMLSVLDVKVLADDKRVFPPYQACILARADALAQNPDLRRVLSELSGKISNDAMRKMNYEVDGKHRAAAEVAKEFLDALH